MDAKFKSGVLAVGIVGGLVVVVGAIVAIASNGSKDTGRHVGSPPTSLRERERDAEREKQAAPKTPQEQDRETKLVAEIAAHPWWKVKPTESRVREIVGEMTEIQADGILEIGPGGETKAVPLDEKEPRQGRRAIVDTRGWPVSFPDGTYVYLDGRTTSRRLTRIEAGQRLRGQLDSDDFRRRK